METTDDHDITERHVEANGLLVNVAEAGHGPAVVLLHGWPHTWLVWRDVIHRLAPRHRVVAPDLRGLGATQAPATGFDLHTLADDLAGLLTALDIDRAALVAGLDLGAPVAWMAAARHPDRVERLAVMESLLGTLPGAEAFLGGGPPWWFGFHRVPGLPEAVLAGNTDPYISWFLRAGTHDGRGLDAQMTTAFLRAFRDPATLRAGFDHYRALPANAELIADAAANPPLALPVLALGGATVGDALWRQLVPITPDLRGEIVSDCGHIVPADAPDALVEHLRRLLRRAPDAG